MPTTLSLARISGLAVAAACALAVPIVALDGQPGMHDPSTVIVENGKYYVYATGGGALPMSISDDGWSWRRAGCVMQAVPGGKPGPDVIARGGNNTWAPDLIRLGDKYFLYYSAPGTQPKSAIGLLVGKTLDPESPDYKWEDAGPVVWSDGVEDSNAIDPGVFRDPTNGTLWLTYGSYFGYIRLVELNPKTGKRLYPDRKPVNVAINSEASIMIFRDGWYYLLVTHGSCCQGANSSYNIRMGRAKKVTGRFSTTWAIDMLQGGGKLFLGSGGRFVGPGHFGLLDLGDGVEKFSCHYEADLDRGGISVLDIRPLLWRDGWPVAGENVKAGTYAIESARTGTALELAVQGVPVGGLRGRGGRGAPGAAVHPERARRPPDAAGGAPDAAGRAARCACGSRASAAADSAAGGVAGLGELAVRAGGCPHGALHAPGAAAVDDRAGRECRWLPRVAVLQDHDRRNGSHARRDGGSRAGRPAGIHRRAGATVAHRPARRWHLPPDAEGGAEFKGAAGAVRRRQQHADARQIQPGERSSALEHQDAMRLRMNRSCRGIVPLRADRRALACGVRVLARSRANGQEGRGAARRGAAAGVVADAAGVTGEAGRRRRLHPAMAAPRADSGAGSAHGKRGADGGREGLFRAGDSAASRRRQAQGRRQ